jgi:hypothetical protein
VATLLEVASILKDRPLKRPITFLFNEGEELGLVGARAFLADPLSHGVDSLINLEARGVRGPVNMFETSRPNAAPIAAFAHAVDRPVANSLSVDVYRLLPNYTDVNTFADRGWATLNLAMIGNETRYHSAGDDFAALDRRSLQHMGDQTLALAVQLAGGVPKAGGERIFMDLAGVQLITLPLWAGVGLLGLLTLAFAWLAWQRRALGRAMTTVAGALLLSGVAAWAAMVIIGLFRPGMWWRAEPLWTHLAVYASTIAVALALLASADRKLPVDRLRPAFWLVFLAVGVIIALIAPGGIIFFLFPPLFALAGIGVRWWWAGAERAGAFAAIAALFLTWGELLALLEELLNQGPMWLFAPLGALVLLPALIEAKPLINRARWQWAIAAAPALALWIGAAAAPAYSADRQQRFAVEHITDHGSGRAIWSVQNDRAPICRKHARCAGPYGAARLWRWAKVPFSERERWVTEAPSGRLPPPQLQRIRSDRSASSRRVRLRMQPNGALSVALIAPKDSEIRAAGVPGFTRPIDPEATSGEYIIRCFGRSCEGLTVDIVIGKAEPIEFILLGTRPGLPPAAASLLVLRPRFARPQYAPDATIAFTRVRL